MQLDQQALNALPGDERVGLEVTEDTFSRGPSSKGAQFAGQSAVDYLSNRWGSLASLDSWRGTGDASTLLNLVEWLLTRA